MAALTYKQRKQRVKACFDDLLQIAEGLIAQAKAGEITLTAGLLKEINTLLTNLSNQAEAEESQVRPSEELAAAMQGLPDDLRKPLRTN